MEHSQLFPIKPRLVPLSQDPLPCLPGYCDPPGLHGFLLRGHCKRPFFQRQLQVLPGEQAQPQQTRPQGRLIEHGQM